MHYTKDMVWETSCLEKKRLGLYEYAKENYLYYLTMLISLSAIVMDYLIIKHFIDILLQFKTF